MSSDACERVLGYSFKNLEYLQRALVHSSNRLAKGICNERMEFLGDSILGAVVAEYLFNHYQEFEEGRLTKVKSVVVSRPVLAKRASALGLEQFIMVGPGLASEPLPETVLANTFEAIICAIYIDGGLEPARRFVLANLEQDIDTVVGERHKKNYKSLLQRLVQRKQGLTPTYCVIEERGPDHVKEFHVAAVIGGDIAAGAWGDSKKAAEQLAAEKTYKHLLDTYGTKDE